MRLIQGVHIQTIGVVAGDSPVLDAGIQILDRTSAVPAEGILLELPSFPAVHRDTIPLGSMITSNREEHSLILDIHRAGIGDGRFRSVTSTLMSMPYVPAAVRRWYP